MGSRRWGLSVVVCCLAATLAGCENGADAERDVMEELAPPAEASLRERVLESLGDFAEAAPELLDSPLFEGTEALPASAEKKKVDEATATALRLNQRLSSNAVDYWVMPPSDVPVVTERLSAEESRRYGHAVTEGLASVFEELVERFRVGRHAETAALATEAAQFDRLQQNLAREMDWLIDLREKEAGALSKATQVLVAISPDAEEESARSIAECAGILVSAIHRKDLHYQAVFEYVSFIRSNWDRFWQTAAGVRLRSETRDEEWEKAKQQVIDSERTLLQEFRRFEEKAESLSARP